jgi:hypothetical protein
LKSFVINYVRVPEIETHTAEPEATQGGMPPGQGEPQLHRAGTEVLQDLRQGWLAANDSSLQPESGAPAPKGRRLRSKRPKTVANHAPLIESVKVYLRETIPSAARRYEVKGEQGKSAAMLALVMIACLTVLVAIGGLVYAATVGSILDPGKLSGMVQTDSLDTSATANPPIANPPILQETAVVPAAATGPANAVSSNFDWADAVRRSGSDYPNGGDQPANPLSDDNAIMLPQTFALAAGGLASKAHDQQTQHDQTSIQSPGTVQAAGTVQAPTVSTNPGSIVNVSGNNYRQPNIQRSPSDFPDDDRTAPYLDLVRSGQVSIESKDFQSTYQSAAQAISLDPRRRPALELAQATLAAGGGPRDAEGAAVDAIAHGGKAVFELQHFHASPPALHPARIVITATTLEFVPEAPGETGAFTIPLASITSVQLGKNASGPSNFYLLNIKFDDSRGSIAKGTNGEISFRDSSSRFRDSLNAARISSQLSPAQETALFTALRGVLLAEKGRS